MRIVLTLLLCIVSNVPVLAGPPTHGTYTSIDLGGSVLPGRYSESWYATGFSLNNTLNVQSWDGNALGTQWHWYCSWIQTPPVLLANTIDSQGNGEKIWRATYSGGYGRVDGAGPWAGGDPNYFVNVHTWIAIVTVSYQNFVEMGAVRQDQVLGILAGYDSECVSIAQASGGKRGDTTGGAMEAGYPDFWDGESCADTGTAGPGEWGDVNSIIYSVDGCPWTTATLSTTWGAVKSLYRN